MRVLFTRPKHDTENRYLHYWTEDVVQLAKEKGAVLDLEKEKATKVRLQGYLKKDQASHIFLNGHGSDIAVYGHDNEELISINDDSSLFEDKVFFVRACSSAKILGPEAIKKGAKAFIGYVSEFHFWRQGSFFKDPLKDPFAKPFMECSNQVMRSLLKGHTPSDANRRSKDLYKKEIIKAFTSEGDTSILPSLLHNMKNQTCIER